MGKRSAAIRRDTTARFAANTRPMRKGHATYICKACSRLSAAEKAEAQTINRLMNFSMGRLSANDKA